ncbi:MAG: hypothetical protein ACYC18_14740 [Gammaproteobacteria bacterium]
MGKLPTAHTSLQYSKASTWNDTVARRADGAFQSPDLFEKRNRMASKKRTKPSQFYMHEAMDRAFLAHDLVAGHLYDHPGVKAVPKALRAVRKASDLLWTAYQEIGRVHLGDATAAAPGSGAGLTKAKTKK